MRHVLRRSSEQVVDFLARSRVIWRSQVFIVCDFCDHGRDVVGITGGAPGGLAAIQKMIRIGITVDDGADEPTLVSVLQPAADAAASDEELQ